MSTPHSDPQRDRPRRERAGVFDIRTMIGLLMGIYGVILVVTGLVGTTEEDLAKADGVNLNLWTGISLIVVAAVFFVWARLRPILVPTDPPPTERDPD
ncbi:hypothetical protein [Thermomonospora amylolytica]|uniref:hypothetical protein n=1 Tax=Thermomonospora amylolytica TaxID=1411117 RepID=UPI000E6BCDB7|nr:hypothetical protein [Thermomonospora amylolytica]